jgi:hypothetical protein
MKKLNGRPLLTADKRVKKIDVRFTEEEYRVVEELEAALGISKTELVRRKLLDSAEQTVVNAKELVADLNNIGAELGRSGNNINQLARHANVIKKQGRLSPFIIESFTVLFATYLENQKSLETALRRIIREMGR